MHLVNAISKQQQQQQQIINNWIPTSNILSPHRPQEATVQSSLPTLSRPRPEVPDALCRSILLPSSSEPPQLPALRPPGVAEPDGEPPGGKQGSRIGCWVFKVEAVNFCFVDLCC